MSVELFDVLTYDTDKGVDIGPIGIEFVAIATAVTPVRPEGLYELQLATAYTYDNKNHSVVVRWRANAGVWYESIIEPRDVTDKTSVSYGFPISLQQGSHTLELQMKKEEVNGILMCQFADISLQRVGKYIAPTPIV